MVGLGRYRTISANGGVRRLQFACHPEEVVALVLAGQEKAI